MRIDQFGCCGTITQRQCCWIMRGDIIPVDRFALRAAIETEFQIAVDKFGRSHVEIMGIAASWGYTMDDEQALAALHKLNETGSSLD